jgi:hypothetical protein
MIRRDFPDKERQPLAEPHNPACYHVISRRPPRCAREDRLGQAAVVARG